MSKTTVKNALGAVSMIIGLAITASASAAGKGVPLPPQDAYTITLIDKAVIAGTVEQDADKNLVVLDTNGNGAVDMSDMVKFNYKGSIHPVETDPTSAVLIKMEDQIGTIEGQALFPVGFASMSALMNSGFDYFVWVFNSEMAAGATQEAAQNTAFNALMDMMAGMGIKFPAVIPWTCQSCVMVVDGTTYISIVDALDPINGNPDMIAKFDGMLSGGAEGAVNDMRLDGRAFTGLTPAMMNPFEKKMAIRMAGCSAVVAADGPNAGKVGTLCMNATATFDVSGAAADFTTPVGSVTNAAISAEGTSNCVTVLHTPTM